MATSIITTKMWRSVRFAGSRNAIAAILYHRHCAFVILCL